MALALQYVVASSLRSSQRHIGWTIRLPRAAALAITGFGFERVEVPAIFNAEDYNEAASNADKIAG